MSTLATESGHYYYRDGRPCYTIIGKNGKERNTTIKDCRALDLVPSYTTIEKVAAKPALVAWMINQAADAVLTLPRMEGEDLETFKKRALADSKEQASKAADTGSELHGAIELWAQAKPIPDRWAKHVCNVSEAMLGLGLNLPMGKSEHSFAHASGYGGKVDWHNDELLVDFKTKARIDDEKQLAWDEHRMQLGAYRKGLGLTGKAYNIFVGVEDAKVVAHEWTPEELDEGYEMFKALFRFWSLKNGYQP